VVLPEESAPLEDLMNELKKAEKNRKTNKMVIVGEGNHIGDTIGIAQKVKEAFPHMESKVTILGHLQRGGCPTCFDRVMASQLGIAAVEALLNGKSDIMVGMENNRVTETFLQKAINNKSNLDTELLRLSKILSI
jgi:6-phosphofructokinase 1